ncbi:hypothetical protein C7T94_17210 [Pedobacter yulinensis]|uniref:Uncharacterized protein n=1 Tax=Pedobacter yulinensis TaxID=2126353 RepID=A0A2T3HHS9_9SPHI|nr:hypothetical protein [Pedobacter yulinensis]PST81931.1 hypothetical protein C7T94_17210 [Pedobacter yulinensis]
MKTFLLTLSSLLLFAVASAQHRPAYRMMVYESPGYRPDGQTFMTMNHYTLYQDGSIYKSYLTGRSPAGLVPAASKRAEPGNWGSWDEQENGMLINWPEATYKTETWKRGKYYKVLPGSRNDRLTGKYVLLTGQLSKRHSIWQSVHLLEFNANGSLLAEAGGIGASKGKIQTFAGRYTIDGYSITFRLTNNQTETFSFYFMPARRGSDAREENSTTIGIGQTYFIKKADM